MISPLRSPLILAVLVAPLGGALLGGTGALLLFLLSGDPSGFALWVSTVAAAVGFVVGGASLAAGLSVAALAKRANHLTRLIGSVLAASLASGAIVFWAVATVKSIDPWTIPALSTLLVAVIAGVVGSRIERSCTPV